MFTILNPADPDESRRWDDFVVSHPRGTPFHLTAWIGTLAETSGFKPRLFTLSDDTGKLRAIAPFLANNRLLGRGRLVCLPFSDFCCPLATDDAGLMQIIEVARKEALDRAWRVEIRSPLPPAAGFTEMHYYNHHVLPLQSDPDEILKKVDKRTIAYNIRRARKAGIEIIEDNSTRGCDQFYQLYVLTRKKHGIPSQPNEFFRAISRNMVERGWASILLAVHGSRVVAGGVFFKLGDTVYYKYNASDPRALAKLSPNHLLAWTAISRACLEGHRFFDFGRTAPDNEGLMRYKKMWGGDVHGLPYSYYPGSSRVMRKREHSLALEAMKGFWRLLPEPLAARIGPRLIKYFG
jgi:CelD/BcsL family acetyltransferase involved in cellulose biosynthesis